MRSRTRRWRRLHWKRSSTTTSAGNWSRTAPCCHSRIRRRCWTQASSTRSACSGSWVSLRSGSGSWSTTWTSSPSTSTVWTPSVPTSAPGPERTSQAASSESARPQGSASDALRLLPAEHDRVVGPLDVDLVPEREDDEHPGVAPAHGGIVGPECLQQVQRRLAVHPLVGLRLSQKPVGEAVGVALQPVADRDRESQLRALRDRLR